MSQSRHEAWLSLGSNVTDASDRIVMAVRMLAEFSTNHLMSEVYETPALNGRDSDYSNAVIRISTSLSLEETNRRCKDIEVALGRTPAGKLIGCVEIDIDIVVWDNEVTRPADFSRSYFTLGYNRLKGLPQH